MTDRIEPIASVNRLVGPSQEVASFRRIKGLIQSDDPFAADLAEQIYKQLPRVESLHFRRDTKTHVSDVHDAHKNTFADFRRRYAEIENWLTHPIHLSRVANFDNLSTRALPEDVREAVANWRDSEQLELPTPEQLLGKDPIKPRGYALHPPQEMRAAVRRYWKLVCRRTSDAILHVLLSAFERKQVGTYSMDPGKSTATFTFFTKRYTDTRPAPNVFTTSELPDEKEVELSGEIRFESVFHDHVLREAELMSLDTALRKPEVVVPVSISQWCERVPEALRPFVRILVGKTILELTVRELTDEKALPPQLVKPKLLHPLTEPNVPLEDRGQRETFRETFGAPDPDGMLLGRMLLLDPCVCFGPFALTGWGDGDSSDEIRRRERDAQRRQRIKEICQQLKLNEENLERQNEEYRRNQTPSGLIAFGCIVTPCIVRLLSGVFSNDVGLHGLFVVLFWLLVVICTLLLLNLGLFKKQKFDSHRLVVSGIQNRRTRLLDEQSLLVVKRSEVETFAP